MVDLDGTIRAAAPIPGLKTKRSVKPAKDEERSFSFLGLALTNRSSQRDSFYGRFVKYRWMRGNGTEGGKGWAIF